MLQLPRHPKYNTLDRGSTRYGRQRLLLTLSNYRLWDQLIELADTMYLEATNEEKLQNERLRYLGIAYALTERLGEAETHLQVLRERLQLNRETLDELKAEAKAEEENKAKADEPAKAGADAKKAKANRSYQKVVVCDRFEPREVCSFATTSTKGYYLGSIKYR